MGRYLFLMLGYPGAGKTTVSRLLNEITGAQHLWADNVRREMYKQPTYSHSENLHLYAHLNQVATKLLATGKSVIYDTNFSFYKDREKLRQIASHYGTKTIVMHVTVPKSTAKRRATVDAHLHTHTRVLGHIPERDFERMAANIEKPRENEQVISVDGTKVSKKYIELLLADANIL